MPRTPLKQLVADQCRFQRQARGWTQEKLAELAGLPQSRISEIERADSNLQSDTIDRIADAFEIPQTALTVPVQEAAV